MPPRSNSSTSRSPLIAVKAAIARWGTQVRAARLWISTVLGAAVLIVVLNMPAQAAQVQILPNNPQLGDTLSVVVQLDEAGSPPTVSMRQKTYSTFPIGNNRYRAFLPTTPLDAPGRLAIQVNAGGQVQNLAVQLRDRSFPSQSIWVSGGGSDGTDYEFDKVDAFKALVTPQKLWNGPFARPSQGEVTTVYGVRRYYNGEFAQDYYHRGVDYADGVGTPIVAPAPGKVALIGREANGFKLHGNTIGLDHGQGVESIFIHLSRIDVKEGDMVQKGQVIGGLGATGSATGPNLHWGLYVNGESVDPVPWRDRGFE